MNTIGEKMDRAMVDDSDIIRLSFGSALNSIMSRRSSGMRLPKWSPDVVIRVQRPDENSKMTAPYLYVESRFGKVPWKETMIELFSQDWEVIK